MTYYNIVWLAEVAWDKSRLLWGINFTNLYLPIMCWSLLLVYLWFIGSDVHDSRRITEACTLVLLVFFATTKLVNEPYAVWVLPLLLMVSLYRPGFEWSVLAVTVVPFVFIAFNVPLPNLFRPFLTDTLAGLSLGDWFFLDPIPRYTLLFALGITFTLICLSTAFAITLKGTRVAVTQVPSGLP